MNRTGRVAILIAVIALTTSYFAAPALAQSPNISTGVVTHVETTENGDLIAFSIVDGDGNNLRFTVSSSNPNTSYGLENRVGDRWVSDQASAPQESATRLRDQQNRLAQISVQSDSSGVAMSVVQAQSTDIDTNLGYVFAVVAIAWIGIMAYVVYMGVRQRTLSAELSRLRGDNGNSAS